MRRLLLLLFLYISYNASGQVIKLLPVKIDYKWGYIDLGGKTKIPPRYDRACDFKSNPYALVELNGKAGLIDTSGTEIILPQFDDLEILDTAAIKIRKDTLWGIQTLRGRIVCNPKYEAINKLTPKYFVVSLNDKWGIMNYSGEELIAPLFDSIKYDPNDFFILYEKGKIGLANLSGKQIANCSFKKFVIVNQNAILFQDSLYWQGRNNDGEILFSGNYIDPIFKTNTDFILLRKKQFRSIYSIPLKKIISDSTYQDLMLINNNYILTYSKSKMGVLDRTGKVVTEPVFQAIDYDQEGVFRVCTDNKWGLMNEQGKVFLNPSFDIIEKFNGGYSRIKNDDKWGLIGIKGNIIHPCNATRIDINNDDAKVFSASEKVFYTIDKNGNVADAIRFSNIKTLRVSSQDYVAKAPAAFNPQSLTFTDPKVYGWYQSGGKWGLKDTSGKVLIPAFLDEVEVFPSIGMSLVQITSFDQAKGITVEGFGVVDHLKGKFLLRPGSEKISIKDFENGEVCRVILAGGRHALLSNDGKLTTSMIVKTKDGQKSMTIGYIGDFCDGYARINFGGKISYSNHNSEEVLTSNVVNSGFNWRGYPVCPGGSWGYINNDGNCKINPGYAYARDFKYGLAIVKTESKNWGVINQSNSWVVQSEFDRISYLEASNDSLFLLQKFNKLCGALNSEGKIVIEAQYDDLGEFCEGFAKAKKDHRWGFINTHGDTLTGIKYVSTGNFSEDLAAVRDGRFWGFIDKEGKIKIPALYSAVGEFHQGLAWATLGGKSGYINQEGVFVIEAKFKKASNFHGNIAIVKSKKKFGIISKDGKWFAKPAYSNIEITADGYAIVKKKRFGLINPSGKHIIPCKYDKVNPFKEGLASVKNSDKHFGFIDTTGKVVIDFTYKNSGNFHEGLARVYNGKKWGYINHTGKMVIEPHYRNCNDFNEGMAYVLGDHNGFIDKNGHNKINLPSTVQMTTFSEGLALIKYKVKDREKQIYKFIKPDGKDLSFHRFSDAKDFNSKMAFVKLEGTYGVLSDKGIFVVRPRYDKIDPLKGGYAKITKVTFSGIANLTGKRIITSDYETIEYLSRLKVFRVEKGDAIGYLDLSGKWIWNTSK